MELSQVLLLIKHVVLEEVRIDLGGAAAVVTPSATRSADIQSVDTRSAVELVASK
jgi:hypothetical protein